MEATIFLVDQFSHLRMYSIDGCLLGIYPLYERKSSSFPLQQVFWNDQNHEITVVSEEFIQRIPYWLLCGTLLYQDCESSFFCRPYTNYCRQSQTAMSVTPNACVDPALNTLPLSQHASDTYTCEKNENGCILSKELTAKENLQRTSRKNDIICSENYCKCKVNILIIDSKICFLFDKQFFTTFHI